MSTIHYYYDCDNFKYEDIYETWSWRGITCYHCNIRMLNVYSHTMLYEDIKFIKNKIKQMEFDLDLNKLLQ